jgi:hypothetical protein
MKLSMKKCALKAWRVALFGQDQFAQARGLQAVGRAVVVDLHRLLPAQDFGAVDAPAELPAAWPPEAVSVCAGARAGRLKVYGRRALRWT